jgi:hypothetical protein
LSTTRMWVMVSARAQGRISKHHDIEFPSRLPGVD